MVNSQSLQQPCVSGINGSFDLGAAIAGLLFDAGCNSLELPIGLTAEQRKEARLVADQHPELKCESYGFGADRRLHVFKKSATTCIRVKNTFVDGWAAIEGDENASDQIIFRSVPVNLCSHPLYSGGNAGDGKLELPPLCTKASRWVTPECRHEVALILDDVATITSEELKQKEAGSPCGLDDAALVASGDWKEKKEEHPLVPPGIFDQLPLGTLVVIQGLIRAPAFNGCVGVVHSVDAKTGRYDVLLTSPSGCREQWAKVKYENMRRVHDQDNASTAA